MSSRTSPNESHDALAKCAAQAAESLGPAIRKALAISVVVFREDGDEHARAHLPSTNEYSPLTQCGLLRMRLHASTLEPGEAPCEKCTHPPVPKAAAEP